MRDPEVEEFQVSAFDVISRLGLMGSPDPNDTEAAEECCRVYIGIAFPNLTDDERFLIFKAHLAVRAITTGVNTITANLSATDREQLERTIRISEHREFPESLEFIAAAGIRGRLSELQAKLLDDLLEEGTLKRQALSIRSALCAARWLYLDGRTSYA